MPKAGRTSRSRRSPRASRARRPSADSAAARPETHPAADARSVVVTSRQALWLELMSFYVREAWLLDERKFTEWLDLFTEDVVYFMPRRKNVLRRESHREVTPRGDLALIEDDRRYLEMRSEEHTSELQSLRHLVCRLLLEKQKRHHAEDVGITVLAEQLARALV